MINRAVSYFDVIIDQKLMKGRLSHQKEQNINDIMTESHFYIFLDKQI